MGLGPGHWDWGKAGSGERVEGAQRKAFLPNKKEKMQGRKRCSPFLNVVKFGSGASRGYLMTMKCHQRAGNGGAGSEVLEPRCLHSAA